MTIVVCLRSIALAETYSVQPSVYSAPNFKHHSNNTTFSQLGQSCNETTPKRMRIRIAVDDATCLLNHCTYAARVDDAATVESIAQRLIQVKETFSLYKYGTSRNNAGTA
jgi:hypothetical protein